MKKLIATVATAGLLVVGGAGAASAADTGGSSTPTQPSAQTARPAGRAAFRRGLRHAVLKVSADTIHIDVTTLRADLRGGQSIAEVAQSKNVDPQTVIDAIVKAADAKVAALVKSNKITAARGAKLEARIPQLASRVVNRVPKRAAAPGTPAATGSGAATG
jgi:hypothetical protein